MIDDRKRALAKLGYVECVCVKSNVDSNWFLIERAEHNGRVWTERIPNESSTDLSITSRVMASARISDADIEGHAAEMLLIATAIETRGSFFANRCAVSVNGDTVALWSPRNSQEPAHIALAAADRLVESIRSVVVKRST